VVIDILTSDIVLATLWAPSGQKWSLYENVYAQSFYQALGISEPNN